MSEIWDDENADQDVETVDEGDFVLDDDRELRDDDVPDPPD